ncbi:type I restriction enzyme HsdR N-terminal domain-containing protein [Acinetobacter pittii]|uniref:type I restriction enzyme HsdR N-terminal domain-containing protein n=1 Tax=Acinetobacter pittii TaxID=48296 RepID=UPI001BDBA5C4|nr:type I restriction enzyme HsdR N-terminal domain-containing protein [Acinetobacter pittii]
MMGFLNWSYKMLIDKSFDLKENLLLNKTLKPLNQNELEELLRIQNLDVSEFSEADVREEIINPIIKILGYSKGEFSSVDREKHVRFLGKTSKYLDYSCTVFKENFWIIEAKKPLKKEHFGYKEFSQALEYSIHPEINASIIVLCDGLIIELFDRDENVESPLLSFKVNDLVKDFDNLRKILSPINIWFFYKRKVLKAIDKAFEKEFNQSRLNEFLASVDRRFDSKKSQILKNFQATKFEDKNYADKILDANLDEIVDIYFYFSHNLSALNNMNALLLEEFKKSKFPVIFKIFPDEYKLINEDYCSCALSFLLTLELHEKTIFWAPSWLKGDGNEGHVEVESLIKKLIKLMLNYFDDDLNRKLILIANNSWRRLSKILYVLSPELSKTSELKHLWTRVNSSEFSWEQILTSPKRNILIDVDNLALLQTRQFVREFSINDGYDFKTHSAKEFIKKLWELEQKALMSYPNYKELLDELDLGEILPTECIGVSYDYLGHIALCILKRIPKWEKYLVDNHKKELIELGILESWAAKEILDKFDIKFDKIKRDEILSERFFFGDSETQNFLSKSYYY